MVRARSISGSAPGGTVPWPRLRSLRGLCHVYLYEKKSSIFANKDLLMNKASVLFFQAVNQHQCHHAVPSVTMLGESPAGTDPSEEDHQGCATCISGRGSEEI